MRVTSTIARGLCFLILDPVLRALGVDIGKARLIAVAALLPLWHRIDVDAEFGRDLRDAAARADVAVAADDTHRGSLFGRECSVFATRFGDLDVCSRAWSPAEGRCVRGQLTHG